MNKKRWMAVGLFFLIPLMLILAFRVKEVKQTRSEAAGEIDLMNFLGSDYNYNGMTSANSYLDLTAHYLDMETPGQGWKRVWWHDLPGSSCEAKYGNRCRNLNWHFPYQWKKMTGENVWKLSKTPALGANQEVFWYNDKWVYVLSEAGWKCSSANYTNCFHNFYHPMNSGMEVEFPNRGMVWFKRYFTNGEMIVVPGLKINHYTDMTKFSAEGLAENYEGQRIEARYYPSWNSAMNTWDGKADDGNLPADMEVVRLTMTTANGVSREDYYYGRKGSYKFGLIRYESWIFYPSMCGAGECPTDMPREGDWGLIRYHTTNLMTRYDGSVFKDNYLKLFQRYYYSDPKMESDVGIGRLERGKFQLPGGGVMSNGVSVVAGSWVNLTEVLTDRDWMIVNGECPNGYQYGGSFGGNMVDFQGKTVNGGWVTLCGTSDGVVWSESCPQGYVSRGWFEGNSQNRSTYDYLRRDISGKRVQFCTKESETKVMPGGGEVMDMADFALWTNGYIRGGGGDFNGDGRVDMADFVFWMERYI